MISALFGLQGKTALITGSSKGLGLVFARGLGQAGATVVLNSRNQENLHKAVKKLSGEGINAFGYPFDITRSDEINKNVGAIEKEVGPIDILVNNAGVQLRGDLAQIEESVWRTVIDTNLTGAFLTAQQVVKGMIARKSGKIINICSLMSELGRNTTGPYTSSKGGLKMLTKAMVADWAKHNIQINGIGPGYFITEMTQVLADNPEFDSWLKKRTPAERWGKPEELVGTLIFLASDASNFINGQIIYVDGGILACL